MSELYDSEKKSLGRRCAFLNVFHLTRIMSGLYNPWRYDSDPMHFASLRAKAICRAFWNLGNPGTSSSDSRCKA